MRLRELDLLRDLGRLEHLAEVLHADVAVRVVRRVVRPVLRVEAPAASVVQALQRFVEAESPQQYDLATGFAERGDAGLREPFCAVGCVVLVQDLAQLLVGGVAGAFALQRHDESFGGVAGEEVEGRVDQVAQIFRAG